MRWLGLVVVAVCAACSGDGGSSRAVEGDPDSGGPDSGTGNCLDPNDPAVHYADAAPHECRPEELGCTGEQYGFHNACGCGCVDKGGPICPDPQNPKIRWLSRDPAECPAPPAEPACQLNEIAFSNTCGCGCLTPG